MERQAAYEKWLMGNLVTREETALAKQYAEAKHAEAIANNDWTGQETYAKRIANIERYQVIHGWA